MCVLYRTPADIQAEGGKGGDTSSGDGVEQACPPGVTEAGGADDEEAAA